MDGLVTDLYEVRMAASYLRRHMRRPATFSLFARRLPPQRGFLVAAGLADALSFLESFTIEDDELDYLHESVGLDRGILASLRGLRFTGDVWAVPEGRVIGANEPLLEVTAPLPEAQLVETALVNLMTFQTAVAGKAARCRIAAGPAELIDFAFRRCHGIEAGISVARASAIVGFAATSNVAAARRYGLRAAGTMAHSYVQAFGDERSALRAFATDFPTGTVFLVDTYDTESGVRTAADVIRELALTGPLGIRLDSGDLGALAHRARRILDDAGLPQVRIIASGGLDEHSVAVLVGEGAPIDAFGIGTRMGVSYDAPSLDSAYKLVAYGDRPVLKLSVGKATLPGPKQVYRDPTGTAPDLLTRRTEPAPPRREPLLVPVMRAGRRTGNADPAGEVRAAAHRFEADLRWLPDTAKTLDDPKEIRPALSPALAALRDQLTEAASGGARRSGTTVG